MAVKVVDVKSQIVLGIREIGPYRKVMDIIKKLAKYAASRGVEIIGNPIFMCHEASRMPGRLGNIDLEVVVPVGEKINPDEESMETGIICYAIPGGKFAEIIHKGPYEKSEESYKQLFSWIKEKGYRITGPTREVYLNDPKDFLPAELETEIYAPVEQGREDKELLKETPDKEPLREAPQSKSKSYTDAKSNTDTIKGRLSKLLGK